MENQFKPGCLKLFNSEYFQKRHAERMLDDIPYILGFRGIANDFIYPEAEDIERARMCALEQPLNKDRLEELNKIIDGSDWARWNDGEFSRELFEEFGNKA